MNIPKDIIIYFVKLCVMSIFSYYCFRKITNSKKSKFGILILVFIVSVILGSICTYIKFFINQFLSVIVLCLLYGIILGTITKNKIGYSLITTIISYAICLVLFVISTTIEFILYKLFVIKDDYINLLIIALVQFGLIWSVFKIRKFKNGFDFLYKKINNDFFDIIMINVSVAVILVYCLIGTIFEEIDEITKNLSSAFIILVITMGIILPKTLKMYYKQKLLEDTMEEYEDEIEKKDAEIKKLKNEKLKISKISHEFYNRQKALELLVKETNGMKSEISEEIISKNVLEMVKSLTKEYSEEFIKTKNLPKLEETGIPEIDAMFRYMQSECAKNDIEFKLKIIGNIYSLINNIIPKNKLETLIGDHLRDAINAVKSSDTDNKEIFAILGVKDGKYELSIYDTGIEFEIPTLLKLGTEAVTTYEGRGGSGIGFLTTFETMKETKASLIISEQKPNSHYTKSVTIRFDGKNEYKIISYRADEINKKCNNKKIIIE